MSYRKDCFLLNRFTVVQIEPHLSYPLLNQKGGVYMAQRKLEIIVHCEFADKGEEVRNILCEVFRTFAERKTREKCDFLTEKR